MALVEIMKEGELKNWSKIASRLGTERTDNAVYKMWKILQPKGRPVDPSQIVVPKGMSMHCIGLRV